MNVIARPNVQQCIGTHMVWAPYRSTLYSWHTHMGVACKNSFCTKFSPTLKVKPQARMYKGRHLREDFEINLHTQLMD